MYHVGAQCLCLLVCLFVFCFLGVLGFLFLLLVCFVLFFFSLVSIVALYPSKSLKLPCTYN